MTPPQIPAAAPAPALSTDLEKMSNSAALIGASCKVDSAVVDNFKLQAKLVSESLETAKIREATFAEFLPPLFKLRKPNVSQDIVKSLIAELRNPKDDPTGNPENLPVKKLLNLGKPDGTLIATILRLDEVVSARRSFEFSSKSQSDPLSLYSENVEKTKKGLEEALNDVKTNPATTEEGKKVEANYVTSFQIIYDRACRTAVDMIGGTPPAQSESGLSTRADLSLESLRKIGVRQDESQKLFLKLFELETERLRELQRLEEEQRERFIQRDKRKV